MPNNPVMSQCWIVLSILLTTRAMSTIELCGFTLLFVIFLEESIKISGDLVTQYHLSVVHLCPPGLSLCSSNKSCTPHYSITGTLNYTQCLCPAFSVFLRGPRFQWKSNYDLNCFFPLIPDFSWKQ